MAYLPVSIVFGSTTSTIIALSLVILELSLIGHGLTAQHVHVYTHTYLYIYKVRIYIYINMYVYLVVHILPSIHVSFQHTLLRVSTLEPHSVFHTSWYMKLRPVVVAKRLPSLSSAEWWLNAYTTRTPVQLHSPP